MKKPGADSNKKLSNQYPRMPGGVNGGAPPIALLTICGTVFLIPHLAAIHTGTQALWGVDFWRYFHPYAGYTLALLWIAAFIPPIVRRIEPLAVSIGRMAERIPAWLWTLGAIPLLYLLRQRTFLLGDGLLRIRTIRSRYWDFNIEEPLDTMLHSTVHLFMRPFTNNSGRAAYQLVSIALGATVFVGTVYFLKRLYEGRGERWLAGSLLVTAGTVQLFFGYVENYTLLNALVLMLMLSGLLALKRGKPSLAPLMFQALAVAAHPAGIVFLPGTIMLTAWLSPRRSIAARTAEGIVKPLAFIAVSAALILAVSWPAGVSPAGFIASYTHGSNLLPMFGRDGLYGIFSPAHFLDILNELALVAPSLIAVGFITVSIRSAKVSRGTVFLAICALGPLALMASFNPKLGYARDWDLFALAGFPLTFLIASLILETSGKRLFRIGFPLAALSLIHTASWIAVNASETASIERFENIMRTPWWTASARGLAHDERGHVHFERGEIDEYISNYREAYVLTGNMRYYRNVASGLADAGRLDELASFAADGPDVPDGWHMLGTAYIEAGKWDAAIEALGKAGDADSAYYGIHTLTGQAYAMTGRYDEALAAFRVAVERNEGVKDGTRHLLYNNIGTIHAMREQYAEAIGQFSLAVGEKPDFAQGHFSLAKMYAAAGNDSLASEHARLAERHGYDRNAVMDVLRTVGGEQ